MRARWGIIAIALVAATAFAFSVQGGRWWSVGEVEIGPFGSRQCFGGACKPVGLALLGGTERWARTGMGVWAGGLSSMLALIIVAAGLAARRVPRLAAKSALVAIATAAAAAIAFAAQLPGAKAAAIDRGLWAFVAAVVLGGAAAVAVLRARPPSPPA